MSQSVPEYPQVAAPEAFRLRELAGLSVHDAARLVKRTARTIYRWEHGDHQLPGDAREAYLHRINVRHTPANGATRFTFIDLFAGIGGFHSALSAVGGTCIYTSEIDRWARQTYATNHKLSHNHPFPTDIRAEDPSNIPTHDVLVAGFPCQPFSIAGVSKKNSLGQPHGFQCDIQGTLFFDIARILRHHQPPAFLLENVRNLERHDRGQTFDTIMRTLTDDLGYSVSYRVINAKSWVPQNRARIFIAGFREDVGFDLNTLEIPDVSREPTLESILHPEDGMEPAEHPFTEGPKGKVSKKYTLSRKLWKYLQAYAAKHRARGNGFGYGLVTGEQIARTLSARYHKDGSEILVQQPNRSPRRLTPRECARLMGFDQNSTSTRFKIPVSDTQAYRQFGNAVVVPVATAVARHMAPHIRTLAAPHHQLPLYLKASHSETSVA